MSDLKVINENPITMTEIYDRLKDIKKDQDLSYRGEKCLEYLKVFAKQKKVKEKKEKLAALEIPRIKNRHIIKILDLMPEDLDSLRIVMSGETLTITEEDMKKILEVING